MQKRGLANRRQTKMQCHQPCKPEPEPAVRRRTPLERPQISLGAGAAETFFGQLREQDCVAVFAHSPGRDLHAPIEQFETKRQLRRGWLATVIERSLLPRNLDDCAESRTVGTQLLAKFPFMRR